MEECKICQECKIEKPMVEFRFRKERNYYLPQCKKCESKQNNQYNKEHPQETKKRRSNYYQNNKEKEAEASRQYFQNNKNRLVQIKTDRYASDITFKLRINVSNSIRSGLIRSDGSKQGFSILQYLPYAMEELKTHLELQFEPWMTWDNRGVYDPKTWNDNDSSTWTWQIDHIIPASTFMYKSMDCEEFLTCWSLSNLRPYSAKQNILDGVNRIRHNK